MTGRQAACARPVCTVAGNPGRWPRARWPLCHRAELRPPASRVPQTSGSGESSPNSTRPLTPLAVRARTPRAWSPPRGPRPWGLPVTAAPPPARFPAHTSRATVPCHAELIRDAHLLPGSERPALSLLLTGRQEIRHGHTRTRGGHALAHATHTHTLTDTRTHAHRHTNIQAQTRGTHTLTHGHTHRHR